MLVTDIESTSKGDQNPGGHPEKHHWHGHKKHWGKLHKHGKHLGFMHRHHHPHGHDHQDGPHHERRHGPHHGPHHAPHHGPHHGSHHGPHHHGEPHHGCHGGRHQHKENGKWCEKREMKFLKKLHKKGASESGQRMVLISEELLNLLCSSFDGQASSGDVPPGENVGNAPIQRTGEEAMPTEPNLVGEPAPVDAVVGANLAEDMSHLQVAKE